MQQKLFAIRVTPIISPYEYDDPYSESQLWYHHLFAIASRNSCSTKKMIQSFMNLSPNLGLISFSKSIPMCCDCLSNYSINKLNTQVDIECIIWTCLVFYLCDMFAGKMDKCTVNVLSSIYFVGMQANCPLLKKLKKNHKLQASHDYTSVDCGGNHSFEIGFGF